MNTGKQRIADGHDDGEHRPRTERRPNDAITPSSSMREICAFYPGARRALFRRYHIGGCQLCSYDPQDTLMATLQRYDIADAREVLEYLERADQLDRRLGITPRALASAMRQHRPPRVVDVRTLREWSLCRIESARPFTLSMAHPLSSAAKGTFIVFYCQTGRLSLDVAADLFDRGFVHVRWLVGGIDAWSREWSG